jgi:hypothetical protein
LQLLPLKDPLTRPQNQKEQIGISLRLKLRKRSVFCLQKSFSSLYFSALLSSKHLSFQEKDENLDGDAALNKFFREIYQDADEDTRRAMKKSFVSFFFHFLIFDPGYMV